MTPKIGSLFSGYGGLDMGVESVLDARTVWHVEFDKAPSKILAHHWPDVPNYGDVTAVDWSAVEPVDIITGGSPCQDLSHAGKRQGMTEGTRSNLWVAMREAIAQLRPGLVVWENVRGAYSAAADSDLEFCPGCMGDAGDRGPVLRALGRVLGDLSDLGYDCRALGLRAADVGAPHGRFRVFVVASDTSGRGWNGWAQDALGGSLGRVAAAGSGSLLPTPTVSDSNGAGEHGDGGLDLRTALSLLPTPVVTDSADARNLTANRSNPDSKHHSGMTLLDAVSLLPTPSAADGNGGGRCNSPGHQSTLPGTARLLPTPRAGDGDKGGPGQRGSSGDLMLPSAVTLLPTPAVNDMGAAYTPQQWDEWTARMKAEHGNGNGHGPSLNIEAQRIAEGPQARVRRLVETEGPAPVGTCCGAHTQSWALPDGTDYGPAVRRWHDLTRCTPPPVEQGGKGGYRLSPRFSEWMMGLPAGHVTDVPGLSRNDMLKALGNGVVPQQGAAALRFLLSLEAVAA